VSASGGEPQQLTDPDGVSHASPEILPDSRAVLFVINRGALDFDIAVLSLETGEQSLLIRGGTSPRYVPTGHLMYVSLGTLMVVPFDAERLETTGDSVTVLSELVTKPSGITNFDVSDNGVLIYLPGNPEGGTRSLVWVDRQGREEPLGVEPRRYRSVALSPDGDRVASGVVDSDGSSVIWIHHLRRGTFTRLTFGPGRQSRPLWTPDGEHVVFQQRGSDGDSLFWKAADGSGAAKRLSEERVIPFSMSPDGRALIGVVRQAETNFDVVEVPLDGDPTIRPLIVGPFSQFYPHVSPSGNWLAYHSRQGPRSARPEIHVRPYPNLDDGEWQVSTGGGGYPMWSPNEDEIFYRNGDQMVAVPVDTDGGFDFGTPSVLFEGSYWFASSERSYDVAADGQRFLMIKDEPLSEEVVANEIHVVINWFEELQALR
jgi:serine/threonine-protein kinase